MTDTRNTRRKAKYKAQLQRKGPHEEIIRVATFEREGEAETAAQTLADARGSSYAVYTRPDNWSTSGGSLTAWYHPRSINRNIDGSHKNRSDVYSKKSPEEYVVNDRNTGHLY